MRSTRVRNVDDASLARSISMAMTGSGVRRCLVNGSFCAACYTNEYPVAVPGEEQAKIATNRTTG